MHKKLSIAAVHTKVINCICASFEHKTDNYVCAPLAKFAVKWVRNFRIGKNLHFQGSKPSELYKENVLKFLGLLDKFSELNAIGSNLV